jgi:hypothetical protein
VETVLHTSGSDIAASRQRVGEQWCVRNHLRVAFFVSLFKTPFSSQFSAFYSLPTFSSKPLFSSQSKTIKFLSILQQINQRSYAQRERERERIMNCDSIH